MVKQIDDIISFDPAESYEFSDNEVDGNCYRKLVAPDLTSGTGLIGDLAEKWDVSSDGLTFTFHLRDDAHFDSGKPVTAAGRGVLAAARGAAQQDAGLHHHPVRLLQGQRGQADPGER